MKAEELMIGNIILSGKHQLVGYVKSIFGNDVLLEDKLTGEEWQPELKDCAGIPLTEEWLLKMGFTKENDNDLRIRDFRIRGSVNDWLYYQVDYHLWTNDHYCFDNEKSSESISGRINFVHQLQNLYFALTGEELKITASQSNQIE